MTDEKAAKLTACLVPAIAAYLDIEPAQIKGIEIFGWMDDPHDLGFSVEADPPLDAIQQCTLEAFMAQFSERYGFRRPKLRPVAQA